MSMPKRLLGRSRTCPLLATTSKSSPRYLLIVRALAGDSTITRCFFFRAATAGLLQAARNGKWITRLDAAPLQKGAEKRDAAAGEDRPAARPVILSYRLRLSGAPCEAAKPQAGRC